jgi:hypothetical protein
MLRACMFLGSLAFILASGCASTGGFSEAQLRREMENLALRVRHLEDRLSQLDESMGGLAEKALGGTDLALSDASFSSAPVIGSYAPGLSMATRSSRDTGTTSNRSSFTQMVQSALARAGYDPGAADGVMGEKTAAALRNFQRDRHLKVTGSATPATWQLLSKYVDK